MRLSEIKEGIGKEFDVHDFLRKETAYVIYLSNVTPVVVRGKTTFQELDYEVTLSATDTSDSDFGGLLHVAQKDIFRTEEEAEKELFKRKLKGRPNTPHLRFPRW